MSAALLDAPAWAGVVEGLAPVGLDELVVTAGLLARVDRKYVVPVPVVAEVVGRLAGVRVLDVGGRRASAYGSVYFDTPDFTCFRMSAYARRRRVKVRSRTYLDTGDAFTEVKTRGPRGLTVKDRQPRAGADDVLGTDDCGYVAEVLRARVPSDGAPAPRELAPVLRTTYRRTTLALPDGARATVDLDLVWRDPEGTAACGVEGVAVVETKSPGGATVLDRALWREGVRPSRLSKFGAGLVVLDPSLPAHRWCSTLRRLPLHAA
ncbi:VTC domain-containing protein [Sanguibacter sp. HDW7]|uniref:VTC domain-containing protein n=1 Tax=Sanguibacter sp. HDW7 TaxID=2714931 RepID=UPI001F0E5606|nr:VTC domain-containing protein [Sanguibacter sp. HDW7]